jgi:hypothetical protein
MFDAMNQRTDTEQRKFEMKKLILGLSLISSAAFAGPQIPDGAYFAGTAMYPLSGTTIAVTSATTTSTSLVSSVSTSVVVRVTCDQTTAMTVGGLAAQSIVTGTALKIVADAPEYFVLRQNTYPAFKAYATSASCNVEQMGK